MASFFQTVCLTENKFLQELLYRAAELTLSFSFPGIHLLQKYLTSGEKQPFH